MCFLLRPAASIAPRAARSAVLFLLLASAVLVVLAATAMPHPYSWRIHSISESAAQGQLHAWVARLSFLSFGAAVLALSLARKPVWGLATYWLHLVFAACMVGTAASSHKPWDAVVTFDRFEDLLHSATATGMGFAFALGVVTRYFERGPNESRMRVLDGVALVAATVLSPVGAILPDFGGLLQRVMFAVAYVWYGLEAIVHARGSTASDA